MKLFTSFQVLQVDLQPLSPVKKKKKKNEQETIEISLCSIFHEFYFQVSPKKVSLKIQ